VVLKQNYSIGVFRFLPSCETMEIVFCEKCGSELTGAKKFCTTCGSPVVPVRKELGSVDPFASTSQRGEQLEPQSTHKSNYGPPPGSAAASSDSTGSVRPLSHNDPVRPLSHNDPVRPLSHNDPVRPLSHNEPVRPLSHNSQVSPLASSHFVVDVPVQTASKPKPPSLRSSTEQMEEVDATKISVGVSRPPEPLQRFPSSLLPSSIPPLRTAPSEPPEGGPMSMPAMSMPVPIPHATAAAQAAPSRGAQAPASPQSAITPQPVAQQPVQSAPYSAQVQPSAPYSPQTPSPASAPVLAPGARVWVRWANGQNYPGTVYQIHAGRCLVAFADGQQHWIEFAYLQPG
jgi:hypothetical protein